MTTYRLYIGANNITKNVELDLIEFTLNQHFEGYTLEQAQGYWLGKKEDSVVVTVSSNKTKLNKCLAELKEVLKQDAIGYQELPALNFF